MRILGFFIAQIYTFFFILNSIKLGVFCLFLYFSRLLNENSFSYLSTAACKTYIGDQRIQFEVRRLWSKHDTRLMLGHNESNLQTSEQRYWFTDLQTDTKFIIPTPKLFKDDINVIKTDAVPKFTNPICSM